MAGDHTAVTIDQFLNTLFPSPKGMVTLVRAEHGSGGAIYFNDINFSRWDGTVGQLYMCISTCESVHPRSRRPSRKHPVLTYVIVLDDIGTKVALEKLPPGLRPTWAIETSPGNFQVGFMLATPVDPARASALIEALAKAGFTDPMAKSDVRLVRVPGSLNGKPKLETFAARLTTWNPSTKYTFSELAVAFGVTPTDTPPRGAGIPELRPGEVDDVAEWTVRNAGKPGAASGPPIRDLIPLLCPQHELHTVGVDRSNDSSTVWIPGSPGAFKCTHGHCIEFRTREYLQFMRSKYADFPDQRPTTVDLKSLGQRLQAAVQAQTGKGTLFRPPPGDDVRTAILGDLVKVGQEDRYFTVSGQALLPHRAVDDIWFQRMERVGLLDALTPSGRPTVIAPHVWLRRQPDVRRTPKLSHRLGEGLITKDGDLNLAPPLPARPACSGEPTPWLELLDFLTAGDGAVSDHVIDWLAMVVGQPWEKPGWHLMMLSDGHGLGKNLLAQPVRAWLGAHHSRIDMALIGDKYAPWLTKRLCSIDELKQTTRGSTTLHDVYNTLKAWTALGNLTVDINDKYLRRFTALDLSAWLISSNEGVPLPLDPDDRRFLVVRTPGMARPDKWYQDIVKWGAAGGFDQVVGWLAQQWDAMDAQQREVMRGRAPMTQAKRDLIEGSAEGIPGAVRMATIGTYGGQFPELMTLKDAEDSLRVGPAASYLPDAYRKQLSHQRIAQALRSCGWVQLFGGKQIEDGGAKIRVWCRTAQRAVLYEQLGAGKKLVEVYQRVRQGKEQTVFGSRHVRPEFKPIARTQRENPQTSEGKIDI